jgi:hypothetical protein
MVRGPDGAVVGEVDVGEVDVGEVDVEVGAVADVEEAELVHAARALADAVADALPGWVDHAIRERLRQSGTPVPPDLDERISRAVDLTVAAVVPPLRALLATDIDAQRASPLALIRTAIAHQTETLDALGVPPVVRDAEAERLFPADRYHLAPASFADVDPALADAGVRWGAAKAYVHLARRRQEGRR